MPLCSGHGASGGWAGSIDKVYHNWLNLSCPVRYLASNLVPSGGPRRGASWVRASSTPARTVSQNQLSLDEYVGLLSLLFLQASLQNRPDR